MRDGGEVGEKRKDGRMSKASRGEEKKRKREEEEKWKEQVRWEKDRPVEGQRRKGKLKLRR